MKALRLDNNKAQIAFGAIAEDYTVIAPKRCAGRGRFSDTDRVTYETVESLDEIDFVSKTHLSPKSVLFPIREEMFSFEDNTCKETQADIPATIVFLRACDIHALGILDAIFLKQGDPDCYYARRRENLICFLIECPESFDECFCVSMGTNKTTDYSVFIRQTEQGYGVKILDDRFEKYFPGDTEAGIEPRFAREDTIPVSIPTQIDTSLFTDTLWEEYSQRCIACGRCNTSCPTCTCFTVQDIPDKESPDRTTRGRVWSSCQVKRFSLLAGDHDFRKPKGDRMRYKVLHKIWDFTKRFGIPMCVGCGRCDEVCPEYIKIGRASCRERV